jgi:alkylation response protein AidB-like acyl-CoA dehydrogenase
MDYRDTVDEADFRLRLREWIAAHAPTNLPREPDERAVVLNEWHQEPYRAGWIGLTFPVEYGGHGMSPVYEAILNDELGLAGAPPPPAIGHISNALRLFGSDEQKRMYLPGFALVHRALVPRLQRTERW